MEGMLRAMEGMLHVIVMEGLLRLMKGMLRVML